MKKLKVNKKLSLNKETIAVLNNDEKGNIRGGGCTGSCTVFCDTDDTCTFTCDYMCSMFGG